METFHLLLPESHSQRTDFKDQECICTEGEKGQKRFGEERFLIRKQLWSAELCLPLEPRHSVEVHQANHTSLSY